MTENTPSPRVDPDRAVISQILAGHSKLYTVLVNRHKDAALTLALRMVRDRHDAEELVQDAFVRAFRNLGKFRGDACFGTWFYKILHNLCLTRISRRRPVATAIDIMAEETDGHYLVDTDDPSPLEIMEGEELQKTIVVALENLPVSQRTVLTLFYVQDMSYEEIAEVVGMPLGTVKTHLFRGRLLLRKRVLRELKGEVEAYDEQ